MPGYKRMKMIFWFTIARCNKPEEKKSKTKSSSNDDDDGNTIQDPRQFTLVRLLDSLGQKTLLLLLLLLELLLYKFSI